MRAVLMLRQVTGMFSGRREVSTNASALPVNRLMIFGLAVFTGGVIAGSSGCRCRCCEPAAAKEPAALTRVEEQIFGRMPDGAEVSLFTLRNANGMTVKIMSRGATVTELLVPDRDGKLGNVVLGAESLEGYLGGFNAAASVIGRFAGRIANGRFTLDGTEYQVVTNRTGHHLHGGAKAFAQALWQGEVLPAGGSEASVRFRHRSLDGDDGFPGTVDVAVVYTLTDDNALRLAYTATTDRATPINLTNHAYFNLAGAGDVHGHVLWMAADQVTSVDRDLIPDGGLAEVQGTPLDFTVPKAIGAQIDQLKPPFAGYDHTFVLRGGGQGLALAGWVYEPSSGRLMQVHTSEPAMQVYTGKRYFQNGRADPKSAGLKHNALCLETQHYPDSVNHPHFPSTILRPGASLTSVTVYAFSTRAAATPAEGNARAEVRQRERKSTE